MRRILLGVVLVLGCTKAPAETPPAPPKVEAPPKPLSAEQALARDLEAPVGDELAELGKRRLKLEAAGPITTTRDEEKKVFMLSLPLGTAMPVQCYVYDQPFDSGTTIARTIAQMKEKLTLSSLQVWGIEVVERSPALFLGLQYLADSPAGKNLGQLKLALFPSLVTPVFCLHDEPGYPKAFQRIATRLASLVARSAPPESGAVTTYRTISVTSVEGRPIGFETIRYTKGDDGVRHIYTLSTMLLPRSRIEWVTQDAATVTDIAADGMITARRMVSVSNGELQLDLVATHAGGARYTYAGSSSGKALSGSFKTKSPRGLQSDLLISRALLEQLLPAKVKQLEVEQYMPDLTPLAPTLLVMRKVAGGPRRVEIANPQFKVSADLDEHADAESSDLVLGPITLHSERKFFEGSPE